MSSCYCNRGLFNYSSIPYCFFTNNFILSINIFLFLPQYFLCWLFLLSFLLLGSPRFCWFSLLITSLISSIIHVFIFSSLLLFTNNFTFSIILSFPQYFYLSSRRLLNLFILSCCSSTFSSPPFCWSSLFGGFRQLIQRREVECSRERPSSTLTILKHRRQDAYPPHKVHFGGVGGEGKRTRASSGWESGGAVCGWGEDVFYVCV